MFGDCACNPGQKGEACEFGIINTSFVNVSSWDWAYVHEEDGATWDPCPIPITARTGTASASVDWYDLEYPLTPGGEWKQQHFGFLLGGVGTTDYNSVSMWDAKSSSYKLEIVPQQWTFNDMWIWNQNNRSWGLRKSRFKQDFIKKERAHFAGSCHLHPERFIDVMQEGQVYCRVPECCDASYVRLPARPVNSRQLRLVGGEGGRLMQAHAKCG